MPNKNDDNFYEIYKHYSELAQKEYDEIKKKSSGKLRPMTKEEFYGDCDRPNTMENSTATIIYIIVMIVGCIFVDRWMIWIGATVTWLCHIFRHEIRKKNQNKK